MAHEPKLTAYTITLKPSNTRVQNTNLSLFRAMANITGEEPIEDSFIITEVFRKFISALDTQEMYADEKSRKCMTANQPDIEDDNVNPNIILHSEQCIIEGKIEGGNYGKKRNKTSTENKFDKSEVTERDAITDNFYFLLYTPLFSNKSILLLQSYSDDTIDSVMKKFWQNFYSISGIFNKPKIERFVPRKIIDDFKRNATVSSLSFSTELGGETLHEDPYTTTDRSYVVTVQIKPLQSGFTLEEFKEKEAQLSQTYFARFLKLLDFSKKTGILTDNQTEKTTPFELGSSFDIQPTIVLSKYVVINNTDDDFERIKEFCFNQLEDIKSEIYFQNALEEY